MNNHSSLSQPRPLARFTQSRIAAGLLPVLVLLLSIVSSHAGSATWKLNPISGDWNTAANWTPATVPNGPADTATFATSNQTNLSFTDPAEVNGIIFNAGASVFTIRPQYLEISGAGITNNSGISESFVNDVYLSQVGFLVGSRITFLNNATAGSLTNFINNPGAIPNTNPSAVLFQGNSTAGSAVLTNNGSTVSDGSGGGIVFFSDSSTASDATIINNGGTGSALGGTTEFFDLSTADAATVIANGALSGPFGGQIFFSGDTTGGTARIEVFDNANLDIIDHNPPGVTIGSLEGSGAVFLGANNLTVGSNGLSVTFSGIIQNGIGFNGGSFTKIGSGKLTLSGANTYTGGTTINAGTLFVTNGRGSGTGSGPVQVNAGKLGGTGRISGSVIVGDGSGPEAFLTPGTANALPATLTIQKKLTFRADGTDHFGYKSSNATADKLVARGVTIGSGALLFFGPIDTGTLPLGTVFTAISNTAATPIAGTFANLADGATITVDSNTFQANYEGGDGNDLTLTVVP